MPTVCKKMLLSAVCLVMAMATARAQSAPETMPLGGDPDLACNQKPHGRAYWVEYGFCDLLIKGPAAARGLVLWSHGVNGDKEQYKSLPPPIVRRLERAGWDVVKINRNNLYEHGWSSSGVRHRDDAISRALAAKAQGYKSVILAGQSYGGAISLEANAKSAGIDGVLALSPGHGSDAVSGATGYGNIYRNLNHYLLDALSAQKGGRIVVLAAPDDPYSPDRSIGSGFGAQMRAALAASGRPFVVFDETGPIHGHFAGLTSQFSWWFGRCLLKFLDPAQRVASGETVCNAPQPLPHFLRQVVIKQGVPGPKNPPSSPWVGVWQGKYVDNRRDMMIAVETVADDTATVHYFTDAGPAKDQSMGYERYTTARLSGNSIVINRSDNWTITLILSADGQNMGFSAVKPNQPAATATLARTSFR